MSPLVPLTPGGPLMLVLPVVFFTYTIKKNNNNDIHSNHCNDDNHENDYNCSDNDN